LKKCFATRERRICCDGKAENDADIREYCGILQRSQRGEDGVCSRFDFFNGLLALSPYEVEREQEETLTRPRPLPVGEGARGENQASVKEPR